MNNYESVIILKPNLLRKQIQEVIDKVTEKIGKVATVTKKEEIGQRKLAYEIKKNKEGYYIAFQFTLNEKATENKAKVIDSIERYFRTIEEIIRFIVVLEG